MLEQVAEVQKAGRDDRDQRARARSACPEPYAIRARRHEATKKRMIASVATGRLRWTASTRPPSRTTARLARARRDRCSSSWRWSTEVVRSSKRGRAVGQTVTTRGLVSETERARPLQRFSLLALGVFSSRSSRTRPWESNGAHPGEVKDALTPSTRASPRHVPTGRIAEVTGRRLPRSLDARRAAHPSRDARARRGGSAGSNPGSQPRAVGSLAKPSIDQALPADTTHDNLRYVKSAPREPLPPNPQACPQAFSKSVEIVAQFADVFPSGHPCVGPGRSVESFLHRARDASRSKSSPEAVRGSRKAEGGKSTGAVDESAPGSVNLWSRVERPPAGRETSSPLS